MYSRVFQENYNHFLNVSREFHEYIKEMIQDPRERIMPSEKFQTKHRSSIITVDRVFTKKTYQKSMLYPIKRSQYSVSNIKKLWI